MISAKYSELLENLIIKHGNVVTSQQIFDVAKGLLNHKQTQYFITTLTKQGWIVRIKKSLYAIEDLSSRGSLSLSTYLVANLLVKDSFVSFASALNYYGMFDQLANTVVSVALKTHKTVKLGGSSYGFVKTKSKFYFGWQEVRVDNKIVRLATAERALIDSIHYGRSVASIDLVLEKLREYQKDLDFARLNEYAGKMSMTTVKIFGFLLDLLRIDSAQLLKLAKRSRGAHRMVAGAKKFNAKWRIYYDKHFDQYQNE